MNDTTDLAQVTRVTRYFDHMQGLRIMPMGIFLLLGWINGLSQARDGDLTITLPLFIAAIIAFVAADKYYKETFGYVKRRKTAIELAEVVVMVALVFLADWGDATLQWPINLSGLAVAGLSFMIWATTGQFRHQYLALAVVITAVSLSPLLLGHWLNPGLWSGDGVLLLGLVFCIGGGIDHLLLLRALPQQPEETT